MELELLLATAVAIFVGLMMTRVFKLLHWTFPDVTAYLIAGLILGPYCLGKLGIPGVGFKTYEDLERLNILKEAALGFIAFAIGAEFNFDDLREIGKQATVIGVFQSVFAALVVDLVLYILHLFLGEDVLPTSVCITLGAIASATAPAATMMVVKQYKAKGPVTDLLLPIVALDDAVGLVVFAISFGIAQAMEGGVMSATTIILNPILEIVGSVLLGWLMGYIFTKIEKLFYSNTNRLSMTISFVFLTISLSKLSFEWGDVRLDFSTLLVCMVMGTVFCNKSEFATDIFNRADRWTAPLYVAFFVLSGAELDLGVLKELTVVIIGLTYVLSRALGKFYGAKISSSAMHSTETVQKYLGYTLFPQAGVALGMIITAKELGGYEGSLINNVVLLAILIYELVGPSITKWALQEAGEITPPSTEVKSRNRFSKAQ